MKSTLVVTSILTLMTNSVRQVQNVDTWRKGEVVYRFNSRMNKDAIQLVKEAMQEVVTDTFSDGKSCVQFVPFEGNVDNYVFFRDSSDSGCFASSVGKGRGVQDVLIGSDCMTRAGVIPLLLLTLGLYREHQRPDRDQYIDVHNTNIERERQSLFNKMDPASTDLLGLCYDYNSITHFGPYAYAVDPQEPTITANFSKVAFGNKKAMSVSDVKKVQDLYNCGIDTHIAENRRHFQIDCTFENPVCGLVASISTEELWLKSKNNTLVQEDHSRGDGHFMYSKSDGTQLLTLRYIKEGLFCIQIAIFRSDSNTYLELHAELPDRSMVISNTTQSTYTGHWMEYKISVNATTYWRLIIEARVGPGSNVIAVDDVSVTDGWCENWCNSTLITLM